MKQGMIGQLLENATIDRLLPLFTITILLKNCCTFDQLTEQAVHLNKEADKLLRLIKYMNFRVAFQFEKVFEK